MLFELSPKDSIKDIYDREEEIAKLLSSFKRKERFIVVYGVRRVGKTSIIRAALNERNNPYVFLDIKEVYFRYGSVPVKALTELILSEFAKFADRSGIGLEGFEDQPAAERLELTGLLKSINEWCAKKKLIFVLALDEAQYLRYGGKVRYDGILAWAVDNLANLTIVLTGSEVGVLKGFLKYDDVKAPLYGRFRSEIYLERFNKDKSMGFLKTGFTEYKLKSEGGELEHAVDKIGGIVGWLTYYGHYRAVDKMDSEKAASNVFSEGSRIVGKELEELISRSKKRYTYILKSIAAGSGSWREIKSDVAGKGGAISDTILNSLLQNLVKFGIVEKDEEAHYAIVDPVTLHAVKHLKM